MREMRQAGLIFLLVFLPVSSRSDQVTAKTVIDSLNVTIGDPISVRTVFSHPAGVSIASLAGDSVGAFTLLSPPQLSSVNDTSTVAEFTVARYDSGDVWFPPLRFQYFLPRDSTTGVAQTEPVLLHVSLAEVDTTQPIKDLKPPIHIPMTFAEIALLVGILLAAALLLYLLYRYWSNRKKKGQERVNEPVPARPAHLVALEALGALKEKRLWQHGMAKEYHSELTEIIRRYFENRFTVPALEETTEQILAEVRTCIDEDEMMETIREFLERADLVKFAKWSPSVSENERSMDSAFRIVEGTKPGPAAMPDSNGREVLSDVAG